MKNVEVIILAAGRGSRMGHLTEDRPKTLLPVGSKTLLAHILDHLHKYLNPNKIHIYLGYRGKDLQRSLANETRFEVLFSESTRSTIEVGPYHNIFHAYKKYSNCHLLVIYADVFAPFFALDKFVEYGISSPYPLSIAVGKSLPTTRSAVFTVVNQSAIAWQRKSQAGSGDYLNMGYYFIKQDSRLEHIFKNCSTFLEDEVFPRAINQNLVGAFIASGKFINVNTPANLLAAGQLVKEVL